jgi:hypothetical protein
MWGLKPPPHWRFIHNLNYTPRPERERGRKIDKQTSPPFLAEPVWVAPATVFSASHKKREVSILYETSPGTSFCKMAAVLYITWPSPLWYQPHEVISTFHHAIGSWHQPHKGTQHQQQGDHGTNGMKLPGIHHHGLGSLTVWKNHRYLSTNSMKLLSIRTISQDLGTNCMKFSGPTSRILAPTHEGIRPHLPGSWHQPHEILGTHQQDLGTSHTKVLIANKPGDLPVAKLGTNAMKLLGTLHQFLGTTTRRSWHQPWSTRDPPAGS